MFCQGTAASLEVVFPAVEEILQGNYGVAGSGGAGAAYDTGGDGQDGYVFIYWGDEYTIK